MWRVAAAHSPTSLLYKQTLTSHRGWMARLRRVVRASGNARRAVVPTRPGQLPFLGIGGGQPEYLGKSNRSPSIKGAHAIVPTQPG
jgi:hypothetical protein